jgi:archaeosortase B (VPXXXP-CTERM-specific)
MAHQQNQGVAVMAVTPFFVRLHLGCGCPNPVMCLATGKGGPIRGEWSTNGFGDIFAWPMGRKRDKQKPKDKKKREERRPKDPRFLRMAVSFVSLVILADIVVWYLGKKEYLAFIDIYTSVVLTYLIQVSGLPVRMVSNTLYLTNSTWIVTTECTAIYILLIFTSFILVYPASRKLKCLALGTGIPFILAANILRLLIMAWVDQVKPQYTDYFHNYVWQIVFIVMVVFMWLLWIEKAVHREAKTPVHP